MKIPPVLGLNTPPQRPPMATKPAPLAPEVRAATFDLHKMAMGVAMQNLLKRIKSVQKNAL